MKYIMIGGMMRSGTTLIANFLNSQQNITAIRDFPISIRQFDENELRDMKENTKNILLTQIKEEMMSVVQVNMEVDKNKINDFCDVFYQTLDNLASDNDKYVGIKLTECIEVFDILSTCKLEKIKFIYVIRDIRDVLLSSSNMFKYHNNIYSIYQWKKEIVKIKELQKNMPEQVLVLKYEDFVMQKNKEDLENFLDSKLEWELSVFKDRNSNVWMNNSSFDNMAKQKGISNKSLFRWNSEITKNIYLQLANDMCKNELEDFSYQHSTVRINLWTKIRLITIYKIKSNLILIGKKIYRYLNK